MEPPVAKLPVLRFQSCDLESLTLEWAGEPGVEYKLEFRDVNRKGWDSAFSLRIPPSQTGHETVKVTDLLPSMTYIFRLWIMGAGGKLEGPGPDTAFDTEVVSCTPTSRSACCGVCVVS
eukprot:TRINITY_DN25859_c0_g1_i1.p1 TRINITY_DN25859_c0_g1~~TRINITY_DN25859_c0_g1_i1.p1  ORF type:complete len:119 (-),score=28.45 TRINITY_DN25859_c0_g1_i1:147-503(-)